METEKFGEKEILEFWKKNKIYEKSVKKNNGGKKFYFMDGPPYATGNIHLGTALNKILKDVFMRSRRLQGYEVFDRPGYDTHGVPIEFKVEKEIGSRGKQDIEKYGVDKFVNKCKEFATKYIDVMTGEFENLGVWMDWKNPYLTLSDDWIEGIWYAFKEADKKKLLYLGKYPVHVCPRCETAVAFNEIEYAKQKDQSIYVKFPLKNKKNTYLIIFTTTPWTLPANTGIMVNPNADYQEVEVSEGERWIIAKDLVGKLMSACERGFTVKDEFKGKKMEGWEYISPLNKNLKLKVKNGYKVLLSARYVTTEDGSGLVHCAPGHGKEDYEVGKEYGIDMPSPVLANGLLTEETGKYAGKKAREVDKEIIEDLEKDGALVYKVIYEHDYPLCWRDKTPLLMISMPQWFLKISEIQKKILKENEKTNWNPSWTKLRMKAWLEGISDWPISRQRYWGTPLPIWYNDKTGEKIVVGSIEELEKLSGKKKIDLHKPGIDKIEIKGKTGMLKRVPEVLDVWFDSGVSSWAALGYPKNKDKFKQFWPAALNLEGKDQIRGWWNSQMILSQIAFDRRPFENIVMHGMVLDLGKKKMSKSEGGVSPQDVIVKYNRDYMRYYFSKVSKGEDFSYNENEFKEIAKVFMILLNVNNFVNQLPKTKGKLEIEDQWILSKYNSLVEEVTELYNEYKLPEVVQKIENFLVMELSRTYIQMIRERSDEVHDVLSEIRLGLLMLLAPIIPFTTEKIWQELRENGIVEEESIHLSSFSKSNKKKIEKEIENDFLTVVKIIEQGLAARDKEKIGLRWPLAMAEISIEGDKKLERFEKIIERQLNVKKIKIKKGKELKVSLDIKMTPDLEGEGYAREIARKVQAERKNIGLKKGDMIILNLFVDNELKKLLEKKLEFLMERTNSSALFFVDKLPEKGAKDVTIGSKKVIFHFS